MDGNQPNGGTKLMLTPNDLKPIRDQILIKPDPVPEASAGGIFIPETVRADNPNYYTMTGVVLKIGPGLALDGDGRRSEISVAVGQRVTFGRYAGKQMPTVPRTVMLKNDEILGFPDAESFIQPGYQGPQSKAVTGSARG